LFLSINHDDPYAMINWVHVLAIRAREAQWFIDFCNSDLFNNPHLTSSIYAKQTLPLAHFQLKDTAAAKSTLTKGIEALPWLYCSLFSALSLDAPKPIWGVQPRDPEEALHTELYMHTAKDLWNTPQHISLLKEAAAAATVPDPSTLPASSPVTLATARFIYLDNTPALMSSVPRQMLHTAVPNFDFDPLPPAEHDNIFSSGTQRLPWSTTESDRATGPGGGRREDMQAAVARLRREIEREVEDRRARRQEGEAVMRDDEPNREMERFEEEQAAEQAAEAERGRERRFLPREPPAPGIMNYLRYIMQDRVELVDELDEFEVPTGMPGGWGEGWEEEDDGFEGGDDFEGVDDFEGGGGQGGEGGDDAERR
jgi:hypothetical protein